MTRSRVLAAVVAAFAVAPVLLPQYEVTILNYIGLYGIVALGLVLLTGVAGQTSFGQAAFVGMGAYVTAILNVNAGWSPWLTLVLALLVTAAVALALGFITLRMSGHYLPLGTIAWGISLYFLFGTIPELGGFTGITGIEALSVFGHELRDERIYAYLIWAVLLFALWATANLLDSRPGRAIRSLRGGAAMAEAFGVDTAHLKIVVFVYAALLACVSGWLYAHLQRFVNPTPFSLNAGIEYLFMAVIGGAGNVWGAVIGAAIITISKDQLQDILPILFGEAGQFEVIVFGALMVVILQRARDGVWPLVERLLPAPRPVPPRPAPELPHRAAARRGEALLVVDGARKEFGGLVAVNDLSFELAAGEILGLIGPNGAGKTTMFNLISGALPLSRGRVLFRGEPIQALAPHEVARRGILRTFQHVKLVPHMSVLDNVALGAWLRGSAGPLRASLRLDRAEEASALHLAARQIERVGLSAHLFDPAGSLALGRQRVVEIARALAADPVLLLLDEPAAGLRFREKQELAALLRALRDEGVSILLVEHDMDFVMGITDRLVVMEFGQLLAQGLPADIQRNPAVREAYLGGVA